MFDEICTRILSPPKFKYSLYDLGSMITKHGKRTDFVVHNKNHNRMNCSLYQPHNIVHQRACVIYLHSMNGSRLEGQVYSQLIIKEGISYCTFDFSGCGNSDGEKITFGAKQKYDIEQVINKLKEKFYLNRFILWGRSMGAVSAIKYAQLCYDKSKVILSYQKEQVIGLILDSSFKSFSKLLIQIGHTQTQIPRFLVQAGYFMIRSALQQNGQFKVQQLDLISDGDKQSSLERYPLTKIKGLQLPILFLASKQDKTVPCQHSIDMFNAYKCKHKQLRFFKGLHNQSREEDYIEEVLAFITKILPTQKPQDLHKSKSQPQPHESLFILDYKIRNYSQIQTKNQTHPKPSQPQSLIPDPISIHQQKVDKRSLIKLIQERFFNVDSNESNQTFVQVEGIESSCVCTMFDKSHNGGESRRTLYKQKEKQQQQEKQQQKKKQRQKEKQQQKEEVFLLKDYNWSRYENKSNFNCDRISLKDPDQNSKVKKIISTNDSPEPLVNQYHRPKLQEESHIMHYQAQRITSPRNRQEKINGNLSLLLLRENIRPILAPKSPQFKADIKPVEDLYKPLRVSSETSQRNPLKRSGSDQ